MGILRARGQHDAGAPGPMTNRVVRKELGVAPYGGHLSQVGTEEAQRGGTL